MVTSLPARGAADGLSFPKAARCDRGAAGTRAGSSRDGSQLLGWAGFPWGEEEEEEEWGGSRVWQHPQCLRLGGRAGLCLSAGELQQTWELSPSWGFILSSEKEQVKVQVQLR